MHPPDDVIGEAPARCADLKPTDEPIVIGAWAWADKCITAFSDGSLLLEQGSDRVALDGPWVDAMREALGVIDAKANQQLINE
jgi:hypothetical protein